MPTPTRQRILDAALGVIRTTGHAAVTMRSVADATGVTATALYRHFRDKDALLAALRTEARGRFLDTVASGLDRQGSAAERLQGVLVAARTFGIEQPRLYAFLFLDNAGGAPALPDDPGAVPASIAPLVDVVEECIEEGSLNRDSVVTIALVLTAMLHGVLRYWLMGRFGKDRRRFEDFADDAFVRLLKGLAPPDAPT